jgi:hypothetical protein
MSILSMIYVIQSLHCHVRVCSSILCVCELEISLITSYAPVFLHICKVPIDHLLESKISRLIHVNLPQHLTKSLQ